jgi:hypothetical protein
METESDKGDTMNCDDTIHFGHSDDCRAARERRGDMHCRCEPCPECGGITFDPLDDDTAADIDKARAKARAGRG